MAERPLVDERAALRAAALVAPVRRTDAAEVARLRADIHAELPDLDRAARGWTRLGEDLPPTTVSVVGRTGWVKANLETLRGAFDLLSEKIPVRSRTSSRILGIQLGAILGLLSTKVLGQFVLPLQGKGTGQLIVVGPNVLALGEEHGELAADIRRTVVLHEITHRLQFDGVPWLADHLRDLLAGYLTEARVDRAALLEAAGKLPDALRRAVVAGDATPVMEAVLTEGQREIMRQAQGLMSVLEGHGNAAMYGAAPSVVDDPEAVRRALGDRPADVTTKVLTIVAGLEMKKRQYRDGEAFVTSVVEQIGVPGFNRVFEEAANLPSLDEVADPPAWVKRTA